MKVYIKNMVCQRCISSVEEILRKNKLTSKYVRLGEIELTAQLTKKQSQQFAQDLTEVGFELLDDNKIQLIEKIKTLLIEKTQQASIEEHFSISEYLTKELHKDYASISRLFSEVESITIEQFFILQKTEKVKELLTYNELTLSEIAWRLGYSSVAHLSAQFKKVTGLTPSNFKSNYPGSRKPIDKVNDK